MGILKNLMGVVWKPKGNQETKVSELNEASFLLIFKDLVIGKLWVKESIWHFEYSDEYKEDESSFALMDFPDKNKLYRSQSLWPFFVHRIPGLKQPAIQDILRLEHIDPKDEVQLLRRFGKTTIANPYLLQPA